MFRCLTCAAELTIKKTILRQITKTIEINDEEFLITSPARFCFKCGDLIPDKNRIRKDHVAAIKMYKHLQSGMRINMPAYFINIDGAKCPYCEHVNDIDLCDLNMDSELYEKECDFCELSFVFSVKWSATFKSRMKGAEDV